MEIKYTNKAVVELLRTVAASYLLLNENRFKIIAYEKAADTVEHMSSELHDMWENGRLSKVSGIGPTITQHLEEYFQKGKSEHFSQIIDKIPASVFVLMKVPSIGPKKAFKLVNSLKLTVPDKAVAELKKAAELGQIESLPTFGKKSQEDIIAAINLYLKTASSDDRMPLPYAHAMAEEIIEYMKILPLKRIDALGSMRRMVSTIGDIDIAVATDSLQPQEIIQHFLKYPKKISIDNSGEKKASIIIKSGIRVDLRVQNIRTYGSMLQYFTGSKAHNVKLREYTIKRGFSLSEWGIKKIEKDSSDKKNISEHIIPFVTEKELYNYFDLDYIPPEIREGTNEIDLAHKKTLPSLVELKDIKGDLHTHSSYDIKTSHDTGADTYESLIKKATSLGYEYIGFADHNPKQSDHSVDNIVTIMKKRKAHIDSLSASSKLSKYFVSLETDILPDGDIALPKEALPYVDFLIVSIHSSFRMTRQEMTARIVKALSMPKVKILAHPTGRLINKRPSIDVDWDVVFDTVKKNNQALEINSWPERLDLPDNLVREAITNNIKCVINTDAHAAEQLNNMMYGVSVARRGWCTKNDIINTLSYTEFKKWISD